MKRLEPVPHKHVRIEGGFWGERLRVNREVTIPTVYRQCKKTGRIDAFKMDWKPGDPNPPHIFWDSDVAKWIESASYSLATHSDKRLEKQVDDVIDLIASAQQDDGYLNVHFTVVEPEKRWAKLSGWHELYCAGHLMEAATAYYAATRKRKLLDVMCRYADYIDSVFGRGRGISSAGTLCRASMISASGTAYHALWGFIVTPHERLPDDRMSRRPAL